MRKELTQLFNKILRRGKFPSFVMLPDAHVYVNDNGYDAGHYWSDRLDAYRHSFRGVGNITLTEDENIAQYSEAAEVVWNLFRTVAFTPAQKSVLDIGCGNGFWSGIFQELGVGRYTGFDVTDVMFDVLRKRHPGFQYATGDLLTTEFDPGFQLISMIDVTQHITNDNQLQLMLRRIRSLLASDGVFIVTFWNEVRESSVFYEVFRPFSFYAQALDGLVYTPPVRFRDKFISAFTFPGRNNEMPMKEFLGTEQIARIARRILNAG